MTELFHLVRKTLQDIEHHARALQVGLENAAPQKNVSTKSIDYLAGFVKMMNHTLNMFEPDSHPSPHQPKR